MNASDYDSEDLAEVTKTMGTGSKWKLGGESNALRNDDDVEGHAFLKNDDSDVEGHAAMKNDDSDVEGHSSLRNIDDQGAETDESSDKPGVRVRVRVRNDDDTEGHWSAAKNAENADDDDVEGHTTARNADDDDVEGHTLGAR